MARGWESKSVEIQQELSDEARSNRMPPPASPDERERMLRKESLESTRQRVLADLERATHPRHRQQLYEGLAHLESEIARLG